MAPKGRLPKTVHFHCRNPYDLPRSIHGSIPVITVLTYKVADLGLKFHPPIPIPIHPDKVWALTHRAWCAQLSAECVAAEAAYGVNFTALQAIHGGIHGRIT